MIIKIRDLYKNYEGNVKILKGVNLDIEKGEVISRSIKKYKCRNT